MTTTILTQDSVEFILTADVDWASEYCIDQFLDLCAEFGICPTIFVTHQSDRLKRAFENGEAEAGIHPNFCEGSSHGTAISEVISSVMGMVPSARICRSHRFRDGSDIEMALVDAGIEADSNEVRYLAPNLVAYDIWTGLVRFPVFFEDDVHWQKGGSWDFTDYEEQFFEPGLKVLNFHPFIFALNLADDAGYLEHRKHIGTLTEAAAKSLSNTGAGAASFLRQILAAAKSRGAQFTTVGAALDRYLESGKSC